MGCGWWELGFGAAGAAVNGAGEGEAYPLDGTGVETADMVDVAVDDDELRGGGGRSTRSDTRQTARDCRERRRKPGLSVGRVAKYVYAMYGRRSE